MKLELTTDVIGVASPALFGSWIAERYPTPESAKLQCTEATAAMVEVFPQLHRVRGHAMVATQYRSHWWCVTPEGEVVDPTAHQWDNPPAFYEPLEREEEPHGRCYHCGDLLFRSQGAESFICENCLSNSKVSYDADNAGVAPGKDTNDK